MGSGIFFGVCSVEFPSFGSEILNLVDWGRGFYLDLVWSVCRGHIVHGMRGDPYLKARDYPGIVEKNFLACCMTDNSLAMHHGFPNSMIGSWSRLSPSVPASFQ